MKLITIAGNAFIELFENDMPMALTRKQLFSYGEVVGKKTKQPVDLSGAGLTELRFNYNKILKVTKEGIYVPADNVTVVDLEARFRSNISTEEIQAFQSIEAHKVLGIGPVRAKKTYL